MGKASAVPTDIAHDDARTAVEHDTGGEDLEQARASLGGGEGARQHEWVVVEEERGTESLVQVGQGLGAAGAVRFGVEDLLGGRACLVERRGGEESNGGRDGGVIGPMRQPRKGMEAVA